MAPRVVRRKSIRARLSGWFNFMDLLLWISEEIETRDWDSTVVGTRAGLVLNFLFLLARANSSSIDSQTDEDLFADAPSTGWFGYLVSLMVWSLTTFSFLNAAYTFTRSRNYRLFEVPVEKAPDTPNAHRVRVQSSPTSGSPFRMIANAITSESAESRAHPDKTRDVWEISVWDPLPLCLRLVCLFSPGHALVYWMFLPLVSLDPRPSITVFNCLALQVLLSTQMFMLQSQYAQQIKDSGIVHRQVMNEYDTKFVHPRNQHMVRDVGTQIANTKDGRRVEYVSVGTPVTQIQRRFETHPNPNYAKHLDPDNLGARSAPAITKSRIFSPSPTPLVASKPRDQIQMHADERTRNPFATRTKVRQSPVRRSLPAGGMSSTQPGQVSTSIGTSTGASTHSHGGSLGVYQHVDSPLKKATSLYDLNGPVPQSPRNSREMAAIEQQIRHDKNKLRHSSPSKRNLFATMGTSRPSEALDERYPSRW